MIAGRTFPNQKVTAVAHGALFAGIIKDGILAGCALAYSGSNLTIGAGFFAEAGRELEIVSAETVAVTQLTGYARVKAVIDTTAAATASSFLQFSWAVDYAASVGGFAALTQEDINLSGSTYEMQFCILSLGSGGITGVAVQPETGKSRPAFASAPILAQTGSFTLTLAMDGAFIRAQSTGAMTVTIPAYADAAFPVGAEIELMQEGSGAVTFAAAPGVTIRSYGGELTMSGQYATAGIKKIDTNVWVLTGALG